MASGQGWRAVRDSGRKLPDTWLYGMLFTVSVAAFCLGRVTGDRFGLASDLVAIAGNATCGWSWLLVRALFHKPERSRPPWPLFVVLVMVVVGAMQRFSILGPEPLPRIAGNVENLVSSALLLVAAIEPLRGLSRDMAAAERRFRFVFAGGYAAMVAVAVIWINGALPGSGPAVWGDTVKVVCAVLALFGLAAAVGYRNRHPLPDITRPKLRSPGVGEAELSERILRLMQDEAVYGDPQLKVAGLARRLAEAEYKVTKCITGTLGFRNFNHMVNHFRISQAKQKLSDPACDHLPILTIALDCGFGSIGPFNRAFKAEAAMTPTRFRDGRKANPSHLSSVPPGRGQPL